MKTYFKTLTKALGVLFVCLCLFSCESEEFDTVGSENESLLIKPEEAYPGQTGKAVTVDIAGGKIQGASFGKETVVEGDIIFTAEDFANLQSHYKLTGRMDRLWPGNTVHYRIDPDLSNTSRVTDAIAHWEANTNLRFVVRTNQSAYINFRTGSGCSSSVGRTGGAQSINLAPGCSTGNTIHEIGHAVGIWHEQSSPIRDLFVRINFENIQEGREGNFEQSSGAVSYSRTFDFGSIMMYGPTFFSKNGLPTIEKLDGSSYNIQRNGLSADDIAGINIMYPTNLFDNTSVNSLGDKGSSTKFYFADVNGDGKDDKIFHRYKQYNGDIRVYLATSNGNFRTSPISSLGDTGSSTKFYFADVNGDGKADKIFHRYKQYNGNIRVYLATSNGNFSTSPISSLGDTGSSTKFYFADVNGDGKADKIFHRYKEYNGNIRVYLATSNGNFSANPLSSIGSTGSSTKFYFEDVNGDGKADKIFHRYKQYNGDIRVYLATSNGRFRSIPISSLGDTGETTRFYFADVNGDRKADKIYWRYKSNGGEIRVYLATSNGLFSTSPIITPGDKGESTKFYFADVNGDDKADKIFWRYKLADGKVKTYLSN